MWKVPLYIHLGAALITAGLVTLQRERELAARGHLLLLALTMMGLALVAWPWMLWVAAKQYFTDAKKLR